MNYKEYNDYELVCLAQEQNEDAINLLHEKYRPLILKKSKHTYKILQNKGTELADLIQECTIGFEEAIQNFNPIDDTSFYTFASLCMDRQLMSEITRLNRDKHKFLNEAIPLETLDAEEDNINLIDVLKDYHNNPEDLITTEEKKELFQKIEQNLSKRELEVFNLMKEGYSYKEMSTILKIEKKSIDNSIQRIKNKIKKMMINPPTT